MSTTAYSSLAPALGLLVATLALHGCSNPREDVRVTLCKDMVVTQLGPSQSVTWTGSETETRGYEYAAVRLRFSAQGGDGQAACYYDYAAADETAVTQADPLSAYATSPFKMTLDGQELSKSALAQAVKNAMLKQGRELVDRAKKTLE